MQVRAFGILPESSNSPGGYSGGMYEVGMLTPTSSVQVVTIEAGTKAEFDDSQALFKASENKGLAKEFAKQGK